MKLVPTLVIKQGVMLTMSHEDTTSTIRYTRSLGPSKLVRALHDRESLHCDDQPVTFLARLPEGVVPAKAAASVDSWGYGCGEELGIFAVFDGEGEEAMQVWDTPREEEDRHHPERSPSHVWIDAEQQPLPFERAVYVQSPEELEHLLTQSVSSPSQAEQLLEDFRQQSTQSIHEQAIARARQLDERLQELERDLQTLRAPLDDAHAARVTRLLEQYMLPTWIVHAHAEHLSPLLRQALAAIEHLARSR